MRFDFVLAGVLSRAIRVFALAVAAAALASCGLDFDALERGRRDGGRDLDAHVPPRDAAFDDAEAPDADTRVDSGVCPAPADCSDPACAGQLCDDGLGCTTGDVCGGGTCVGVARVCPNDGCSASICQEPTGSCVVTAAVPDGTTCAGGVCCYGRCSNLADSGNCGGCGLGCDEETCTADPPPRCVCVTNAGCPLGQQCQSGRCVCSTSSQCAAGQTCVMATGHCTY